MKVPASEEHAGKLTYAHRCSTGVSHLRDHERSLRSRGHRRTGHLTQLGQNWNALFGDADRLACSRDQALAERFFIINKEFEQNQISFGHVHFGRGNGPFREVTFGKKRKASHIIYRGWLRAASAALRASLSGRFVRSSATRHKTILGSSMARTGKRMLRTFERRTSRREFGWKPPMGHGKWGPGTNGKIAEK